MLSLGMGFQGLDQGWWAANAVGYEKTDAWYVAHLHIFLLFLLLFADPNLLGIPFRLSTKII
jgi:hypothetical protein